MLISKGYHVCLKIHIIRVVLQDKAHYIHNTNRVSQHAILIKRVYFSCNFTYVRVLYLLKQVFSNLNTYQKYIIRSTNVN